MGQTINTDSRDLAHSPSQLAPLDFYLPTHGFQPLYHPILFQLFVDWPCKTDSLDRNGNWGCECRLGRGGRGGSSIGRVPLSSELRSQNVFLLIVTGSRRVMIGKACRRSRVMTFIAGVGWGRERSECKEQSQHLHSSFVHVYQENRKGPSFYLLIIPSYTHLDHPLEFPLDESMAVSTMEERGRPKSSVVVPIQRYSWRRDGAIVCLLCGKTGGECLTGSCGGRTKIVNANNFAISPVLVECSVE